MNRENESSLLISLLMRTFPFKSALLLLLSLFLSWQLFLDHVKRNVGLDCSLEDAGEIPQNLEKEDYMLIEGMCVCVCEYTHSRMF